MTASEGLSPNGEAVDFSIVITDSNHGETTIPVSGFSVPRSAMDLVTEFLVDAAPALLDAFSVDSSPYKDDVLPPVGFTLDYSRINGALNSEKPTTPSLVLRARLPEITSLAIVGGEELGFGKHPIFSSSSKITTSDVQFDDGRSTAVGFGAEQVSAPETSGSESAEVLVADDRNKVYPIGSFLRSQLGSAPSSVGTPISSEFAFSSNGLYLDDASQSAERHQV